MTLEEAILIIGIISIVFVLYTYEIGTRAYSSGFKEGLEIGKKLGKIDAQAEKVRIQNEQYKICQRFITRKSARADKVKSEE